MTAENLEYFKYQLEIRLKAYEGNSTSVVSTRRAILQEIYDYYKENGFPIALTKESLSLIPFHFQEARYDGIEWYKQNGDLGHLLDDFQIDCIFQNEGKNRQQLTKAEFEKYITYSYAIIDNLIEENKHHR
jgi:hypothetical protein